MRSLIFAAALAGGSLFAQPQTPQPSFTGCDQFIALQMTTATTTQLVALQAGKSVRVCSISIQGSVTATATTLRFVQGSGTACATGTANVTPAWTMPASSTAPPVFHSAGSMQWFFLTAGNAFCATSTAAGTVNIFVTFTVL